MAIQNIFVLVFFVGFGLWWIVFPRSVMRFYGAFHRGKARLGTEGGIRIAGSLWIAFVAIMILSHRAVH